jgi:hypothetical protein
MREIFVFGSNREGRHSAGAAKTARLKHGAIYGQAEGLQGDSYAIITKELRKSHQPVTLKEVCRGVVSFLYFAASHPDWTFNVTDIGCGLAGFKVSDIAPMFVNRSKNVIISKRFEKHLNAVCNC